MSGVKPEGRDDEKVCMLGGRVMDHNGWRVGEWPGEV